MRRNTMTWAFLSLAIGSFAVPGGAQEFLYAEPLPAPVITAYPPSALPGPAITTYYPPTPFYPPAAVGAYAPAPIVAYRPYLAPSPYLVPSPYLAPSPVIAYRPIVTPYAPAVVAARPVVVRPKVYVPGQPIRNVLRAITP